MEPEAGRAPGLQGARPGAGRVAPLAGAGAASTLCEPHCHPHHDPHVSITEEEAGTARPKATAVRFWTLTVADAAGQRPADDSKRSGWVPDPAEAHGSRPAPALSPPAPSTSALQGPSVSSGGSTGSGGHPKMCGSFCSSS